MAFECENPCPTCAPAPAGTRGLAPNDPNNPYLNLSSESPDVDNFIGRGYTLGQPPLGQFFYAVGCLGFCVSSTSQADADLCAQLQNVLCTDTDWPISTPNPDYNPNIPNSQPTLRRNRTVFYNTAQTCTVPCPNGGVNSYTVPAGVIGAFNQLTANTQAYSLACVRAAASAICLTDLASNRICYRTPAALGISATGIFVDAVFTLVGGAMPDGLTLTDLGGSDAVISGTPTTAGDFTFTIRATDVSGTFGERTYTMEVFGITNFGTLTAAVNGTPYSTTLVLGGTPVGVFDYTVVAGSLPPGLTLNAGSGIISGTPTTSGSYSFTIAVEDQG